MDLILADAELNDIRFIREYEVFDAECGEYNDFELAVDIEDYREDLTYGNIIYSPGAECGGIIGELETDTNQNRVTVKGYTWRGLLQHKIIKPVGNYKTVSGDLAGIVEDIISEAFDRIFTTDTTPTGVEVTNYQFDRYCTVLDGLEKLLRSKGYRLSLEYSEEGVVIAPVSIVDYSAKIEMSSDFPIKFRIDQNRRGVTTLICLGKGELAARTVVELYAWPDGSISDTDKYYSGIDEIVDVYDYSSADDRNTLVENGKERLKELMNSNTFDMDVDELDIDVAVGDIVGGRDYITGMHMVAPIKTKLWRIEDGDVQIDYTLEGTE